MGALKRITSPSCALVKIGSPVSAFTAWSWLSPCAPTTQTMDSAPPPVVLAMGEPFPLICAHHALVASGGGPAEMRSATSLFVEGHPTPFAGNASIVPEGVEITAGAEITTPFATWGAIRPPPIQPR